MTALRRAGLLRCEEVYPVTCICQSPQVITSLLCRDPAVDGIFREEPALRRHSGRIRLEGKCVMQLLQHLRSQGCFDDIISVEMLLGFHETAQVPFRIGLKSFHPPEKIVLFRVERADEGDPRLVRKEISPPARLCGGRNCPNGLLQPIRVGGHRKKTYGFDALPCKKAVRIRIKDIGPVGREGNRIGKKMNVWTVVGPGKVEDSQIMADYGCFRVKVEGKNRIRAIGTDHGEHPLRQGSRKQFLLRCSEDTDLCTLGGKGLPDIFCSKAFPRQHEYFYHAFILGGLKPQCKQ